MLSDILGRRLILMFVGLIATQTATAQPLLIVQSQKDAVFAVSAQAQVATTTPLSEVPEIISARSPDVLAAQAAHTQADAQEQQARAAWFGRVDTYAMSQHYNDPRLTGPITLPPNVADYPFASNQFGYGVNVQLPIDISGQIAAEVDVARTKATGAYWSAEDMRLRALLQGATLYRNLQAMAGQRQALDKQLQALQASARVAEIGLKVGNIARVNLLRVQAAVSAVQARLPVWMDRSASYARNSLRSWTRNPSTLRFLRLMWAQLTFRPVSI